MGKDWRVDYLPLRALINTKTTTTPVAGTVYLYSLIYNCTNAGSGWTLTIQDKAASPLVLYTLNPLVLSSVPVVVLNLNYPIPMIGGIDIITGGTTAGALNVWGAYAQN